MFNKKPCLVCEKVFEYERASKKYCSIECRRVMENVLRCEDAWDNQTLVEKRLCEFCGRSFMPNKHTPNQPFCSPICRRTSWQKENREKYLASKRKERQTHKERYAVWNKEYKNQTRFGGNKYKCFERDGYKCVECKKPWKNEWTLVPHHIDKTGQTEHPNHSLDNLITLCRSCHIKIHPPVKRSLQTKV